MKLTRGLRRLTAVKYLMHAGQTEGVKYPLLCYIPCPANGHLHDNAMSSKSMFRCGFFPKSPSPLKSPSPQKCPSPQNCPRATMLYLLQGRINVFRGPRLNFFPPTERGEETERGGSWRLEETKFRYASKENCFFEGPSGSPL